MSGGVSVLLVDADIGADDTSSLGVHAGRIVEPAACVGERRLDLRGDRVLPGLINAHDHLQLNNFPRLRFRACHDNAGEWIADIESRRATDARLVAASAIDRGARLRHGLMKNLLAGATTVAHHDPLYPELSSPQCPVRVLTDYGWSHSLGVDSLEGVRSAHRATPAERPWFIHAGEGTDEEACAEFAILEAAGCLTANARFIHGVAFTPAEMRRLAAAGAGLIWCPASNDYLFGRTADVGELIQASRVALGSDSRLSGSRDLLTELAFAHATGLVPETCLETLVTGAAAKLLGLGDRGALVPGMLADLVILPRGLPLSRVARADLRCVMVGGEMRYGDRDYACQLAGDREFSSIYVDGRAKVLDAELAREWMATGIVEPGVELCMEAGRAA